MKKSKINAINFQNPIILKMISLEIYIHIELNFCMNE